MSFSKPYKYLTMARAFIDFWKFLMILIQFSELCLVKPQSSFSKLLKFVYARKIKRIFDPFEKLSHLLLTICPNHINLIPIKTMFVKANSIYIEDDLNIIP